MNVLIITEKHLTWVYGDYRINECKKFLMEKSVSQALRKSRGMRGDGLTTTELQV